MRVERTWVTQASAWDLQAAMIRGDLTSEELTSECMAHIARHNDGGRGINAVLELNPDALQSAAAADAVRRVAGNTGPLQGIPVLLKDNIATADKMHTSAGSLALADSYAEKDSFVAVQLRRAGAVILGKANMTEWANFMAEDMPNGYSSRGGQVRNPYGAQDPGGSSSGSAAAVAAGFAPLSVGTETSGSILNPASACSVVGIKPTVGLVSRSGIIPISFSQDTAGPMARTVTDAALMLNVLARVDEADPVTFCRRGREVEDYTLGLNRDGLQGVRLGIVREYFTALAADAASIYDLALTIISEAGAELVEIETYAPDVDKNDYRVLLWEFKPALNAYLGRLPHHTRVRSLRDVIEYNKLHGSECLRYGQTILERAEEKSGELTQSEYISARLDNIRHCRAEGIDQTIEQHNLAALLFPGSSGCGVAARAGYPSISVPAGYSPEGRPLGLTFTGSAFSEHRLIRLAYAYEQHSLSRRAPSL